VKHNIKVFLISLVTVLSIGMVFIVACLALIKVREVRSGSQSVAIDFDWLSGKFDYLFEGGGDGTVSNIEEEGVALSDSEVIYEAAVDNGENVRLVECADTDTVTFAFAGDILLDDRYAIMYKYKLRGSDINDTFSASLLERMRSADIFMLNNEFPFSTRGSALEDKQFTFRANPSNISLYEELGVDIVSLANNHAYDYGESALLDTFDTLESAGIPYVGAGRNIDEAMKPVYFVANGMKIAVVSATQIERNSTPDTKEATATSAGVLRCMDETKLLSVIAEAKDNSDFVILYIHWGTESVEKTDWLQDKQAPIYANAGVDLIIGDHPHCLQKLDSVSGVPVAYSLGNFWFNSKTQNTCLIEVGISKEEDNVSMEYFKFIPCRQSDCRTIELEGSEKTAVLDYMRSISPNVTIDDEGYVTF
jgi:poly-gamma-glutamate synthesis protein (capsule biosynthesis protein)